MPETQPTRKRGNFIRTIIERDIAQGKNNGQVVTRFPPEPNGYLHIGHAKSICLNFGFAADYNGRCHLRFDDTNPIKEDVEFIEAIKEDVRWLGFDWGKYEYHASDYFERLYQYAEELIMKGKAYVCELGPDEIREYRGTPTQPGRESPYRNRPIRESLDLFRRMRAGEFAEGTRVLRAKIDMASPNLNMRDPVVYRIRKQPHPRTGDKWCIYPMYDFAHCLSDAIEGVTHSLCTLEFEDHRPLYDWFLDQLDVPSHPQQIEFARLNISYTVLSKRMLRQLIDEGVVTGWGDPRMPTIKGLRKRGYTPESIRQFSEDVGLAKANSIVDMAMLENAIRDDLDPKVPRLMCVHKPLKVVIDNYEESRVEYMKAPYYPNDPEKMGYRQTPFTREIFIEQDDFMEDPPKKFFRLAPGREVRLRFSYIIKCVDVVKDPRTGEVIELHCTYDPDSLGKKPVGRKVKGTIHWVSANQGVPAILKLYDRLFTVPNPAGEGGNFMDYLNPSSLEVVRNAVIEPAIKDVGKPGARFQFERKGFYFLDPEDSTPDMFVFNRIVSLKSKWERIRGGAGTAHTK